jgi:anti-sigma B factor antagonist
MSEGGLEIRERAVGEVAVLDVAGRMVLSERASDALFRHAIAGLFESGRRRVIVNLARVPQVDTSGLTALVNAHLTASSRGGALKLAAPTGRVRDLLAITRLDTLLEVFENEDAAVASFEAQS